MYLCGVECTIATHLGREREEVNHGGGGLDSDTVIPGALVLTIGT